MFSNNQQKENKRSLMTTKEIILEKALTLFSQKGFDSTTVRDIAKDAGITQSSIYKHYSSKNDIFDAIFDEMRRRYDEQAGRQELHIEGDGGRKDAATIGRLPADSIAREVRKLIEYSLDEPFVARTRKMLTIEQFRSSECAALYSQRYGERMLSYHENLFGKLMEDGIMEKEDPYYAALRYTAPIFMLLGIIDRQPERRDECLERIEEHVRIFIGLTSRSGK